MRTRGFLAAIFLCSLLSAQNLPSRDEVLRRIQANLAQFQSSLPNFVVDEKVASKQIASGFVRQQSTTDSSLACVRKAAQGRDLFLESREVTSVNGRRVARGQILRAPNVYGGAFGGLLYDTFAPENVKHHEYTVAGAERIANRNALMIAFETKPGQTALGFTRNGRTYITRDTGKAWIDLQTAQILRLERTYSGMPDDEITMRVDYAPVDLNGRTFFLPQTVYGIDRKIKIKTATLDEFTAEYRNYRPHPASAESPGGVK